MKLRSKVTDAKIKKPILQFSLKSVLLKIEWIMEIKTVYYNVEEKLSCLKEREHNNNSEEFKE